MTERPWIWVTEAEVTSILDMGDAIGAVRDGFLREAQDEAVNMLKTHVAWGEGHTLHAIGATYESSGLAGTKTWAHTKGGATPLLILFDSRTGALAAIIEAFALGQLRTGAVSGVATDLLAAPDASELAMLGTGKQALPQVAAVLAVRPIERVRVFGRDANRRTAFAKRVEQTLNVKAVEAETVREATDGADIITLATRATEPLLTSDMIAPGAHINALGAITPERQEFDPAVLGLCEIIAADSVHQVQRLSREFAEHFGSDGDWSRVRSLAELTEDPPSRPSEAITLSKAMGTGICDVAVGAACYAALIDNSLGRPMEQPSRLEPRFRSNLPRPGVGYV